MNCVGHEPHKHNVLIFQKGYVAIEYPFKAGKPNAAVHERLMI